MFARKGSFSSIGRTAVMATVAASGADGRRAVAGLGRVCAISQWGIGRRATTGGATDFSARRRYYRGGGGAAAAAAFAGIVGTGLAIAATQNRGYYDDS